MTAIQHNIDVPSLYSSYISTIVCFTNPTYNGTFTEYHFFWVMKKLPKFTEKDIKEGKTIELHLDVDTLDQLIFQLILMSNEFKHQILQGNDNCDAVLEVIAHKKSISSVKNPFKRIYPGISLKILGLGYLIDDDNSMGIHGSDDW